MGIPAKRKTFYQPKGEMCVQTLWKIQTKKGCGIRRVRRQLVARISDIYSFLFFSAFSFFLFSFFLRQEKSFGCWSLKSQRVTGGQGKINACVFFSSVSVGFDIFIFLAFFSTPFSVSPALWKKRRAYTHSHDEHNTSIYSFVAECERRYFHLSTRNFLSELA